MKANDNWKDTDAKRQAKIDNKVWCLKLNVTTVCLMLLLLGGNNLFYMQSKIVKHTEEKKNERDSFELQISDKLFSHR
jgi:hypothetical protein